MATNYTTQQSYDPFSQNILANPQGIGAVPTPMPKPGVVYTPQSPGGQVFGATTINTPTYASSLPYAPKPTTTTTTTTNPVSATNTNTNPNGMSMNYMNYYQGWDPVAAERDFTQTYGGDINRLISARSGGSTPTISPKQTRISSVSQSKGEEVAKDYANYADQMSPDEYYAMIDKEAQNNFDFLNQQEQTLRSDQPGIEQNITNQANVLRNRALGVKEDALSAARRLYSELQQGYKQRFGGASSAGEAAMALTNNEQQRQMAQTNRTYQDSIAQIDLSADQAVQSAQSEFRNALLEINKNRTATENERLGARRQALSDLSQKVFAIQQQRETFKQNLALMQEQARLQNEANLKSMNTNPSSSLTTNGLNTTASGNIGLNNAIGAIGNVSSGISKDESKFTGTTGILPWLGYTVPRTGLNDGKSVAGYPGQSYTW